MSKPKKKTTKGHFNKKTKKTVSKKAPYKGGSSWCSTMTRLHPPRRNSESW